MLEHEVVFEMSSSDGSYTTAVLNRREMLFCLVHYNFCPKNTAGRFERAPDGDAVLAWAGLERPGPGCQVGLGDASVTDPETASREKSIKNIRTGLR